MERKKAIGLRYKSPFRHKIVEIAARLATREVELRGQENLDQVIELLDANKRVFFAANHESNFDAAAIDHALDRFGYRKSIAEKLVNVYGIKLEQNWKTRELAKAFSIIPVYPPGKQPKNEIELEQKKQLNKNLPEDVGRVLEQGEVVVIFPESTRSRSGELNEGHPATEPLFELLDDTYVVPVALHGTRDIWPVEGNGSIKKGSFSMSVGSPIDMSELHEQYADLRFKPYRVAVMTEIMSSIAEMLPDEKHGFYADAVQESQKLLQ